jgi:hypothetical protein
MSIERVREKIESLRNNYPNDFRIIRSPDDVDKNNIDYANSEVHGPFDNGDIQMVEVLERALASGKQAFILPVGQHRMLVQTSKSGKLFDLQQSPQDETVKVIRNSLEEMHDRYIGNNGVPLLLGGLDSYIYQEKFAGIAEQYRFPKYKSYDIADKAILNEVKQRLEDGQTVIVIAWTKENRIDVYVEPQHYPQSNTYYSSTSTDSPALANSPASTNNRISVLAAIATFILSALLVGGGGNGKLSSYCCFPIILAGVAYFVAPMLIKSSRKD